MMTLRELNNIIESIDVPIDRISGFCDQYEYMFDRCRVSVIKFLDKVVIETFCDAEEESKMEEKGFYPVPLMIEKLKAEAKCHGDYIVKLDGRDNDYDSRLRRQCWHQFARSRVWKLAQHGNLCCESHH